MTLLMNLRALHVPHVPMAAWSRARAVVAAFIARWREESRLAAELRLMSELGDATRRDLGLTERHIACRGGRRDPYAFNHCTDHWRST